MRSNNSSGWEIGACRPLASAARSRELARSSAWMPTAVTNGVVLPAAVDQIEAGMTHTCAVASGAAYCWGQNSEGRLGNNTITASNVPVTVQAVAGPPCATGANLITPSTCSLTSGTTYYYRVKYVVDGGLTNTSNWLAVKTN